MPVTDCGLMRFSPLPLIEEDTKQGVVLFKKPSQSIDEF